MKALYSFWFVALGTIAVAACQTRSGAAYDTSKNAYVACLNAKGAAACQGERAVMEADAAVYASASGRPQVQSPNQTLGIYR
jgi:hypothetical protein